MRHLPFLQRLNQYRLIYSIIIQNYKLHTSWHMWTMLVLQLPVPQPPTLFPLNNSTDTNTRTDINWQQRFLHNNSQEILFYISAFFPLLPLFGWVLVKQTNDITNSISGLTSMEIALSVLVRSMFRNKWDPIFCSTVFTAHVDLSTLSLWHC